MNKTLDILLAQVNMTVGAIHANAETISTIVQAKQSSHDVLLFPELALTGYPPEDLLLRPEFHRQVEEALQGLAKQVGDCHVILGHPLFENDRCYNAASVLHRGQIIARYRKQKLPNYGVFDERRYFTPGPETACILTINGYKLGLCICEDLWQTGPVEALLAEGADGLLCLNASPFDYEKYERRVELLSSYARQGLAVFYVNLIGGQDELLFDGQSLAFDNKGNLCARLPAFKETTQSVSFNKDQVTGPMEPLMDPTALLYEALVCAVRDYVNKNRFPGVLLGLSGGIDSALTLAIAADALGSSRVHAVLMPSRYTADMSVADAQRQLQAMQVSGTVIPIEPAFQSLLSILAPSFEGLPTDTTEENLQARIRGMLLMALSNKTGNMVLVTSNKSETAVGYATLYGDMAGGFAVLKDVLKTRVYELAAYRNSLSAIIPQRVITRAPSAELAPNQTDQDSLPDYATLDAIIQDYMENNLDAETIIHKGFDPAIVHRVIQLIQRNEYKRRQAAPGPKVSPRAFGREWRYPITNGYEQRPEQNRFEKARFTSSG
ncbi:glutamine dependent NAD+ synthetase [Legionella rubrilucens]|uniref:Glutamine-dependent NAD(+) synthetase n=1 Tax=Legionella rubrilucens TaxID=458 RepID=A0A0W0XYK6_9GAMM|nr:NAD+ synthase [Legionella rubrilucens]KTD49552.1 glutamine dependent NAD+ synthetase [Legionella rubrilucens]